MSDSHAPAIAVDGAVAEYRIKRAGGLAIPPGHVNSELITALALAFSSDELVTQIRAMMQAEVTTKNGNTLPDNRTRLAATQLLLSYLEGRPIERIVSKSTTQVMDPDADLASRLKKSPALRKMMRRLLVEAEGDEVEVQTVV